MEKRHSSPSSRHASPRPTTDRKRSNSFPLVDVLGCSTPEAKLLLAEGRAAVRSRHASAHRRGRRNRSESDDLLSFRPENHDIRPFRPQDHLKYLQHPTSVQPARDEPTSAPALDTAHTRVPSNATDRSDSTITGPTPLRHASKSPTLSPTSPLGDYSANLAQFIKSQLNSIASYTNQALAYPRSCPEMAAQPRTPPRSPAKMAKRQPAAPTVIEIPPVQPPLQSAFSAWSSTDDETEYGVDELPPVPSVDTGSQYGKATHDTPAILQYYDTSHASSFLFSSTPAEEAEHGEPFHAEPFQFPGRPNPAHSSEPLSTEYEPDYPSSALSSRPQLTSSSAPSLSSSSTASYFDYKRPTSIAPHVRERIIAAVSPHKILQATSPFEGGALANVHDVLVDSQNRVLIDGMSFDMMQGLNMPGGAPRVPTPC